ncbi:hypothetical protein D3C78_1304000 [compost metagenome]
MDLRNPEHAAGAALFEQAGEQVGIGFAEDQALFVDLRIDRLGDQREGQLAAVPGARGETPQTGGQTPGGIARGAKGFGEGIQLTPAGAG